MANMIAPIMSERRISIIGAMLIAVGPVSMYLYLPAVSEIAQSFGATAAEVKFTVSIYFAGFACSQLVVGPLSDAIGRRPALYCFIGCFCAASVAAYFADTIGLLIAARFVQGIGAAAGMSISRALVRDVFTGDRSARVINFIGLILAIAPAISPIIGGAMITYLGWRSVFLFMAGFGIAIVLVTLLQLRETVTADWSRLNFAASVRSYREILQDRQYLAATVALAALIGAVYANNIFLPFILIEVIGLSPVEFGACSLVHPAGFFLGSLAVRPLIVRAAPDRLAGAGYTIIGVACLGMAALVIHAPTLWLVLWPVAVFSFGIAFVMPAMTAAALDPFPHSAGAAASMMGFLQMSFGLVCGSAGALLPNPVLAFSTIIPAMGATAFLGFVAYRRRG